MPLSDIACALIRRGVITESSALEAERRKQLYGGGLDTALLELQAVDEPRLVAELAEIIGLPLAPAAAVAEPPSPAAPTWMDGHTAQKLGVVPRRLQGDVLDVFVRPEHDHDGMVDWAAARPCSSSPRWSPRCVFAGSCTPPMTSPCRLVTWRCWPGWSARPARAPWCETASRPSLARPRRSPPPSIGSIRCCTRPASASPSRAGPLSGGSPATSASPGWLPSAMRC